MVRDSPMVNGSTVLDFKEEQSPIEGGKIVSIASATSSNRSDSISEIRDIKIHQPTLDSYMMGWHEDNYAIESEIILPWQVEMVDLSSVNQVYNSLENIDSHGKLDLYPLKREESSHDEPAREEHNLLKKLDTVSKEETSEVEEKLTDSMISEDSSSQEEPQNLISTKQIEFKGEKSSHKRRLSLEDAKKKKPSPKLLEESFQDESSGQSSDDVRQTRFGRQVLPPIEYWRNSSRRHDGEISMNRKSDTVDHHIFHGKRFFIHILIAYSPNHLN